MARFGDAAAEFTHGGIPLNPPASPPKQKFLESQHQKGSTISSKPAFYDDNTEGEKLVLIGLQRHAVCFTLNVVLYGWMLKGKISVNIK